MSRLRVVAGALVAAVLAIAPGCDGLRGLWAHGGTRPLSSETALDGVTQSTPLIVGTIVDAAGHPVAGARVRVFEGFRIGLDGVTQSTPLEGVTQTTPLNSTGSAGLDGVTQTTPLDGVTQTTPLDGVTQTTPLDGVTQTTPLQTIVESRSDGTFAVRVPDRAVLSLEASRENGDRAAILNMPIDRKAARVNVGRLTVAQPGSLTGRVVGPPGHDLAGTSVFIPGTDLVAQTDAGGHYSISGVPARTVAVAAVRARYRPALARFLSVLPGKATTAPDLVLVPAKPRLDALAPDNAGQGAWISLHGADFGHVAKTPFRVMFGNLPAGQVERVSDTEIRAAVPAWARTGAVAVESDGVRSNVLPFTVLASISLSPEATRTLFGESVAVPVLAKVLADTGSIIASPSVVWTVEPPDLGVLSPQHVFRPARAGFGSVVVSTGGVRAATDLGFGEWRMSTIMYPRDFENPNDGPLEGAVGQVRFGMPYGIRVLNDGTVLLIEAAGLHAPLSSSGRAGLPAIRALKDGYLSLWAGTGEAGYDGSGTDRLASRLDPEYLANGPEDAVFVADGLRLRAVTESAVTLFGLKLAGGRIWDVGGNADPGPKGIGALGGDGPALSTPLAYPGPVAWDPSGRIIFAENASDISLGVGSRIREIDASGTVRTLIPGRGGQASDPPVDTYEAGEFGARVRSLAVDRWGNILMGTSAHVWMFCRRSGVYFGVKVNAGDVAPLAGTGGWSAFPGETGRALSMDLWGVDDMALVGDSLLLVDGGHYRIRRLRQDGTLETIAGGGRDGAGRRRDSAADTRGVPWEIGPEFRRQEGVAVNALVVDPYSVALGPSGEIYVADQGGHRILKLFK